MRIAVTGATGFTGHYVTRAIEAAGETFVDLQVDLRDAEAVRYAVDHADFDCLIHLAGQAYVDAEDWRPFYLVNQIGTYNLLSATAQYRPGTRCIIASSAQVYGPGSQGLIAEHAPTRPSNHYAISKRTMEMGADLWRHALDVVVTRPFNYSGVGQGKQYVLPKIVDHFQQRASTIELGNIRVKRDFGDVRSVAEAYVGLALAKQVPPLVNISTGNVFSIAEIVYELSLISKHDIAVSINQALVRTNDVPVLGGDVSLLRSTLPEWQPQSLQDTLAWMLASNTRDGAPVQVRH